MPQTIFLTSTERALYAKLSDTLRAEWDAFVQNETSDAFEDAMQMEYRLGLLRFEEHPELQSIVTNIEKQLTEGADVSNVSLDGLSPQALQMLYSGIGAVGVTAFIEAGLQEVEDAKDLEGIAALSRIRHGLLKSNEEFFVSK